MSRYILSELPAEWASTPIGTIAKIVYGEALRAEDRAEKGGVPVYGSSGVVGEHDKSLHNGPSIIIGRKGTVGAIHYVPGPFWCIDTAFYLDEIRPCVDVEFLAYVLDCLKLSRLTIVVGVPGISRKDVESIPIPIPPLSEQRRIVSILREADELQRLRREAVEKTQLLFLAVFAEMFGTPPNWRKVTTLGQLVKFVGGGTPDRKITNYFTGNIPWATSKDIKSRYLDYAQEHITEDAVKQSATTLVPACSILMVVKSKILMHSLPLAIITRPFCFGQDLKGLVCNEGVVPEFIVASLLIQARSILNRARGVNTEGLTLEILRQITIPDVGSSQQIEFFGRVKEFNKLAEAQDDSLKKIGELDHSIFSWAFTGKLTADWREQNAATLAREAAERDRLLNQQIQPKRISGVVHEFIPPAKAEREVVAALSAKQRRALALAEAQDGYFTAERLSAHFDPEERLSVPDAEQTLQLLAELGLLASVRVATYPTGDTVLFSRAYRRVYTEPAKIADDSRLADLGVLEAAGQ